MSRLVGNIQDFISLVQSRPALYDFTMEEFNNKELTEQLWKEIARELSANVEYCKTKWGVLRVSFARQIRNEKTNATRIRQNLISDWYLKDNMSFMRNYMRKRKKFKSIENYIEIYKKNMSSKSNHKVKTETDLSYSNLEIKNEPLNVEDEYTDEEASLEMFIDDDVVDVSELRTDCISNASSSPLSDSEMTKTENEANDIVMVNDESSRKRKTIPNRVTDQEFEPPMKRKPNKTKDISMSNTNDQEDLSQTSCSPNAKDDVAMSFFKSILPDFSSLIGRRQRLLKQKIMEELNTLLDEQENES